MLPSIDTYLYDEIEDKLEIILTNRYIIKEILGDMNPKTVERFMLAYFGEGRRDIPIMFTMPQEKVTQQGAIFIGLREGVEAKPSIGLHEGTYEFKQGEFAKESCIATKEGDKLFFEVANLIGNLNNVENLMFSVTDGVLVEGNRVYFNYDPDIEGTEFNVNYTPIEGKEMGITKGFTSHEAYSVTAVSTNMDTVRCIDLLLKAIFILMRDNPEEQTGLLLQRLQFGQIEEIDTGRTGANGAIPEMLFGREIITSYEVSYGLDSPTVTSLEDIAIRMKEGVKGYE